MVAQHSRIRLRSGTQLMGCRCTGRVRLVFHRVPRYPDLKSRLGIFCQMERSGPLCARAPVGAVELAAVNAHLCFLTRASPTARATS